MRVERQACRRVPSPKEADLQARRGSLHPESSPITARKARANLSLGGHRAQLDTTTMVGRRCRAAQTFAKRAQRCSARAGDSFATLVGREIGADRQVCPTEIGGRVQMRPRPAIESTPSLLPRTSLRVAGIRFGFTTKASFIGITWSNSSGTRAVPWAGNFRGSWRRCVTPRPTTPARRTSAPRKGLRGQLQRLRNRAGRP